ncbi:hypothetical protein ACKVWC_001466 [Pyricularia oryzae]|nr:hypothetical protein MCOR10_001761 [Pyricularia oryzae]
MARSLRRNSFVHDFIDRLQKAPKPLDTSRAYASDELPSYNYTDSLELGRLVTTSRVRSFRVGTGASIYTSTLLPAILKAHHEAIIVTCFWAPSKTLDALRETLEALAAHRRRIVDEGAGSLPTLRVRICLSSRSLLQKLLHTSSRDGYIYPPSTWEKQLGLLSEEKLRAARIELHVKSLFFLPFSVMHPKFVVIDRRRAFMPSCNVSWEPWLEGCVEFEGDAVDALMAFYQRTWEPDMDVTLPLPLMQDEDLDEAIFNPAVEAPVLPMVRSTASYAVSFVAGHQQASPLVVAGGHEATATLENTIQTTILPSSHHRNPRFRFLPWQAHAPAPATPLNTAVMQLMDHAQRQIYVQTPNVTAPCVIDGLLAALQRGVHVRIVTGRNMMMMEQIVTAGTTTSRCISSLIRRYEIMREAAMAPPGSRHSLLSSWSRPPSRNYGAGTNGEPIQTLSSLPPPVGRLQISYFCSLHPGSKETGKGKGGRHGRRRPSDLEEVLDDAAEEPVCPHIKLMIVDGRYTLLGSGNMDRASFYTSQELGVLFHGDAFASPVQGVMDRCLEGRLEKVYDSER